MDASYRDSPGYWDAVRDASIYLLESPEVRAMSLTVRGRMPVRHTFAWPGGTHGPERSSHAELMRAYHYPLLGRVATTHRLALATHTGRGPGTPLGVTNIDIDLAERRISQVTVQAVPSNTGPQPEPAYALFERIRAVAGEMPVDAQPTHYDQLYTELLQGVLFKAGVLLEEGEG